MYKKNKNYTKTSWLKESLREKELREKEEENYGQPIKYYLLWSSNNNLLKAAASAQAIRVEKKAKVLCSALYWAIVWSF